MLEDEYTARSPEQAARVSEEESHRPEPSGEHSPLDSLLSFVPERLPGPAPSHLTPGLRTAELAQLRGRTATVRLRASAEDVLAELAPEVDTRLLERARKEGQRVLVEIEPGITPLVVGVVQTRLPEHVEIDAMTIEIRAKQAVTLRSGLAGLRLRADGDVELLGTRISAASRGIMRLVGRVLRLN